MELNLKGKTAIICGSTAGIGKAVAHAMSAEGANLILIARNEDKLKRTINELPSTEGQEHTYLVADFNDPAGLHEVLSHSLKDKKIHILVNNTGGPKAGPAYKALTEEFQQAFNQHLICNQYLVKSVIGSMKKEGYGRIINIISTSVKQPLNNLGVSNTIRGAVANWSKTLANELGEFNITVNNVLPGATLTGRLESIIQNKSKNSGKSLESISEEMQNAIPARRFAEPKEVADAVLFLASERAAYINGINLPVDGGRLSCL